MEWSDANKYSSFNSCKGLAYYEQYKNIVNWLEGKESLGPPIECNLDPIAECNLHCYFCVTQRYLRNQRDEVGPMRQLPEEYMYRLVNFLAKWGVKGLCISGGGEPTLHKELAHLPSYAVSKGLQVAVVTNATLISETLASELICCRWVALSVDAADRETYKIVKGRDAFDKVIANIKSLVKFRKQCQSSVDLAFKFLVLPENMHSIWAACKLAKELGVQDFHARPVDFERKDIKGHQKLEIDKTLVEEQFAKCHEEETADFHVYTVTHKFDSDFHVKHDFTRCFPTLILPILADGNAYLCVDRKMEAQYKLGSCYPDPEKVLDWWGSDQHRDLIRNLDINQCSRCTGSQYNAQIENVVLKDKMCLAFP